MAAILSYLLHVASEHADLYLNGGHFVLPRLAYPGMRQKQKIYFEKQKISLKNRRFFPSKQKKKEEISYIKTN